MYPQNMMVNLLMSYTRTVDKSVVDAKSHAKLPM